MAIDEDGTLYMVWPDEPGLLRFSVSRDKAQTWTTPVVVSEPSVSYAVYGGSAVKEAGTLAIAYYGSEAGEGGPFHAYMAETTTALSSAPVFRSSRMNPEGAPLSPEVFDVGYARLLNGGTELHEIVKPEYAPNGDIWTAFARDMCQGHGAWDASTCAWNPAEHVESNWQAAVGRLVHR
jgi:hypothetical protein